MSLRWKNLVFAVALLGVAAVSAKAGSMTTYLTVAARYDNAVDFNPLPLAFAPGGAVANGQPGLYQVDISFTAVKDAGEKGWANTLCDLGVGPNSFGSNLALNLGLGYSPNSDTVQTIHNGPGGAVPIYATNTDAGAIGDLKGILASIVSATITDSVIDPRNMLGTPQAPPGAFNPPDPGSWIGSFLVDWNGLGRGSIVLKNQQYSFTVDTNPQSAGFFGPVQTGAGATALFGVPEPATLTLAGLGLVGLFGFIRRSPIGSSTDDPR